MSDPTLLAKTETDAPDPRSWDYPRVFARPRINWAFVLYSLLAYLILSFFLAFAVLHWLGGSFVMPILASFSLTVLFVRLRSILIFLVELYQIIAPQSIRSYCRFEPSCSSYMIMCLQKFGAYRGLVRGLKRIYRCGHGDGGFDWLD